MPAIRSVPRGGEHVQPVGGRRREPTPWMPGRKSAGLVNYRKGGPIKCLYLDHPMWASAAKQ